MVKKGRTDGGWIDGMRTLTMIGSGSSKEVARLGMRGKNSQKRDDSVNGDGKERTIG
jgi:hypothetical protein